MEIDLFNEIILKKQNYVGDIIGIDDDVVLVKNNVESSYSLYKIDYENMKCNLITTANIGRIYFTGYGFYKIREVTNNPLFKETNKLALSDIEISAFLIDKNARKIMELDEGGICNYYNINKDDAVVITNSSNGTKYTFIKNNIVDFYTYCMIIDYKQNNFLMQNDNEDGINYMLVKINRKSKRDLEKSAISKDDIISEFSMYKKYENKLLILKNGIAELIDYSGNKYDLFKSEYLNYDNFSDVNTLNFKDKYAVVVMNNKYGIIDNKGKEIIKPQFSYLKMLNNGNYIFMDCNKYGISNINANYKKETIYDQIVVLDYNILRVKINDKYGVIDMNSNLLLDIKYKDISIFNDNILMAKTFDDVAYIYNNKLESIYSTKGSYINIISKYGINLIQSDSYYTIIKNNEIILNSIKAKKVFISNNDVISIDGYLLNINDVDMKYGLRVIDKNGTYEKAFKSVKKRNKYYDKLIEENIISSKVKRKFKYM